MSSNFITEQGKRFALVVGVNEAPHSSIRSPLKHAITDAKDIAEVLKQRGFDLFRPPLLGADATSDNVREALLDLRRTCDEKDFILFYFSGHGKKIIPDTDPDGTKTYLVTSNFREVIAEEAPQAHISMKWLRDTLFAPVKGTNIRASIVVIILDCCYSGDVGVEADPDWEPIRQMIAKYFNVFNGDSEVHQRVLSAALAAARYDEEAVEEDGHGRMTKWLLSALRGEATEIFGEGGKITLDRLIGYVKEHMPKDQPPVDIKSDALGGCTIVSYPELAERLQEERESRGKKRPQDRVRVVSNPVFHPRESDFREVKRLLAEAKGNAARLGNRIIGVGIAGITGLGKTPLAVEFALRHKNEFPAGIFLMPASGRSFSELQAGFAQFSEETEYLPADDNPTHSGENEGRRARHICRYFAEHADALLILDNVEEPELALNALSTLAGGEVKCTIFYTSRKTLPPPGIQVYSPPLLSVHEALPVLLPEERVDLLASTRAGNRGLEEEAARAVCTQLGGLPFLLVLFHKLLLQDKGLSLQHLQRRIEEDALNILTRISEEKGADALIDLNWQKVNNPMARSIFKLASHFPEATSIPGWLLALAVGIKIADDTYGMDGESDTALEPFGEARIQLQELSLLESLEGGQVRLLTLARRFGQQLVKEDGEEGQRFLLEARQRLTTKYTNLTKLSDFSRRRGYWRCLERVRTVREYADQLGPGNAEELGRVEYWLKRETYLLGNETIWPTVLPQMLYQQIFNRSIAGGYPPLNGDEPPRWLRLLNRLETEDQAQLQVLEHKEPIQVVAYSPDGSKVVTGGVDWLAHVWDALNGQELLLLRGHTGDVTSVSCSWDSRLVVTGSTDETIRIWDAANGQEVKLLEADAGSIADISLSPDGKYLAATTSNGRVLLWNVQNEEALDTIGGSIRNAISAAWSPNGRWLAIGRRDGSSSVWDSKNRTTQEFLERKSQEDGVRVTWTFDGSLAMISNTGKVNFWIPEQGAVQQTLFRDGRLSLDLSTVSHSACSPDGQYLALGSTDKAVYILDAKHGTVVKTLSGHTQEVTSVAFSPDGKQLISGSEDRTVRIWNWEEASKQDSKDSEEQHRYEIKRMAFSPRGTKAVTGAIGGAVLVWEVASKEVFAQVRETDYVGDVAFSRDGECILIGESGRAQVWNVERRQAVIRLGERFLAPDMDDVKAISDSPDGKRIATGSFDRLARIWDRHSGKLQEILSGHKGTIECIAFSPDGTKLGTGSTDGTARLWDVTSSTGQEGVKQTIVVMKGHSSPVTSLGFSPDGNKLATGTLDGRVRVWSVTEPGKLLAIFQRYKDSISSIAFSPDGRLIATGDERGRTLLWQLDAQGNGNLLGIYLANHRIQAIRWLDFYHLLLADAGGPLRHPHFYHLKLMGEW